MSVRRRGSPRTGTPKICTGSEDSSASFWSDAPAPTIRTASAARSGTSPHRDSRRDLNDAGALNLFPRLPGARRVAVLPIT